LVHTRALKTRSRIGLVLPGMISHVAGPVPRCGRFEVNGEGEVRRVGLVLEPEVDEAVGKEGRGWREGMVWLEKEN
jgi:hypothetical protein